MSCSDARSGIFMSAASIASKFAQSERRAPEGSEWERIENASARRSCNWLFFRLLDALFISRRSWRYLTVPIGPALELEMVDDWVMALGEIELLVGFLDALVVVFLVNWRFLSQRHGGL